MNEKILLTSFQTWLPEQASNSSDDLLEKISKLEIISPNLIFLRQLPVDVFIAASRVIAKIEELQPHSIICCGMAQSLSKLTVESCASCEYAPKPILLPVFPANSHLQDATLIKTSVDLDKLVAKLSETEISHDAGKFVCEGLYYQVLKYIKEHQINISCLFVHVPVLTPDNLPGIVADFRLIIEEIITN